VLRRGEEPIALTPKAFEVPVLLIQHSGEVTSKDELMKAVWPDSFVVHVAFRTFIYTASASGL
jgi:DNA-binding winged helix-turn-helix (wHTH) protein